MGTIKENSRGHFNLGLTIKNFCLINLSLLGTIQPTAFIGRNMTIQYFDGWNLKYIWLGPLPLLNKERLRKTRQDNPHVRISLTISRDIINNEELASIYRFCKRNDIHLVILEDLKKEVMESGNSIEKELFNLIEQELHHPHGNKAGASDLLRGHTYFWLDPKGSGSGVYLDLDATAIPTKEQWNTVDSPGYLIPFIYLEDIRGYSYANDVIILTTSNKKLSISEQKRDIQKILEPVQKSMLSAYRNPLEKMKLEDIHHNPALMSKIHAKTIFDIRKKILSLSFKDWVNTEFTAYKQIFSERNLIIPDEKKAFLKTPFDPANPPPPSEHPERLDINTILNNVYYQGFVLQLRDIFLNRDKRIQKKFTESKNPEQLPEMDILECEHRALIADLYKFSVSSISGSDNFLPATHSKTPHHTSLHYHKFSENYVGQLGPNPKFKQPTQVLIQPDTSWMPYGHHQVLEQSKKIAVQQLISYNFLPKMRAWLKKLKQQKIESKRRKQHLSNIEPLFSIKHWEHNTKPPISFKIKNIEREPNPKTGTLRGESITMPTSTL